MYILSLTDKFRRSAPISTVPLNDGASGLASDLHSLGPHPAIVDEVSGWRLRHSGEPRGEEVEVVGVLLGPGQPLPGAHRRVGTGALPGVDRGTQRLEVVAQTIGGVSFDGLVEQPVRAMFLDAIQDCLQCRFFLATAAGLVLGEVPLVPVLVFGGTGLDLAQHVGSLSSSRVRVLSDQR
jgi:hypothetical protein